MDASSHLDHFLDAFNVHAADSRVPLAKLQHEHQLIMVILGQDKQGYVYLYSSKGHDGIYSLVSTCQEWILDALSHQGNRVGHEHLRVFESILGLEFRIQRGCLQRYMEQGGIVERERPP